VAVDQPRWYVMLGLYPLIGVAILYVLYRFWHSRKTDAVTKIR
jgi:hypothetical protein